jgi:hypothetical protein
MRTLVLLLLGAGAAPQAQDVPIEYQVKAAFLYNFVRFVEWPGPSLAGPLTICVAGRNPLGTFLEDTVRGEIVAGRAIATRVVLEPESDCHVVFVPMGAASAAYLRAARNTPTLTVGESPSFIEMGGIINFVMDGGRVRFEINPQAADRAQLRISSRLLQLARISNIRSEGR